MHHKPNQNRLDFLAIEKLRITHEINEIGVLCLLSRDIAKVKNYSNRIEILEQELSNLELLESLTSALSTIDDW